MLEDQGRSFVTNMMTLVNWKGIPATESHEVREVLAYHIENMKRMDKNSIEFKAALEAAKTLDQQYRDLRLREATEKPECLWVHKSTWKPLGEESTGEQSVSSDTSSTASGDPKITLTEE